MSYGNRGYGRSSFGGDRAFGGPKPVEIGKEYEVQISEISRQGDGIARIQGFVIFVKGAKVGQKTKIRVINVGQRFATAESVAESTPAAHSEHVEPQVEPEEKP